MNEFQEKERIQVSHEEFHAGHCLGCHEELDEKNLCPICDYKNKKQLTLQ